MRFAAAFFSLSAPLLDRALHHGHIDPRVAEEATRNIDDALLELREGN